MPPRFRKELSIDVAAQLDFEDDFMTDKIYTERGENIIASMLGVTALAYRNPDLYEFNPHNCVLGFMRYAITERGKYRAVRFILAAIISNNQLDDAPIPLLETLIDEANFLLQDALANGCSLLRQIITQFGWRIYELLLKPMMGKRSEEPILDVGIDFGNGSAWPAGVKKREPRFAEMVAERDGHCCVVTGVMDMAFSKHLRRTSGKQIIQPRVSAPCEAAHIVPHPRNQILGSASGLTKRQVRFWEILSAFAPHIHEEVHADLIDLPINGIYLRKELHAPFGELLLWFVKDSNSPGPVYHVYTSRRLGSPECLQRQASYTTTFSDHSEGEQPIPLPSETLLELHAALAQLAEMCGASTHYQLHKADPDDDMLGMPSSE